jgi:hypothetical protein
VLEFAFGLDELADRALAGRTLPHEIDKALGPRDGSAGNIDAAQAGDGNRGYERCDQRDPAREKQWMASPAHPPLSAFGGAMRASAVHHFLAGLSDLGGVLAITA